MKNSTYCKKYKVKTIVSAPSTDSERSLRLARVAAYFDKTREQFAKQVATANARATRPQTGVLAGPVARHC